jgi:hypothetical protein
MVGCKNKEKWHKMEIIIIISKRALLSHSLPKKISSGLFRELDLHFTKISLQSKFFSHASHLEDQVSVFISPSQTLRHRLSYSLPSATRRAAVEVF